MERAGRGRLHARDPDLPDRALERHRPPHGRGLPGPLARRALRAVTREEASDDHGRRRTGRRRARSTRHTSREAFQRHRAGAPATGSRCAPRTTSSRSPGASTRDRVRDARRRARRARPRARRHASALMLTNRPEFHWFDAAAMHLGATPFSLYNTYAPEQIEYQVTDAEARIVVTEQAFLDAAWRGARGRASTRGRRRRGEDGTLARRRRGRGRRLRLRRRLAGGRARRPAHADLHSARPGRRRACRSRTRNLMAAVRGFDEVIDFPDDGRVVSWLPMAHIAERDCTPLPADGARLHDHLLPRPAPGGGVPAGGAPDLVLRRAAHLGEAEGGHRGGIEAEQDAAAQAGDRVGARRRPAQGAARAGRRGGPAELRRSTRRRTSSCCRRSARSSASTRWSR